MEGIVEAGIIEGRDLGLSDQQLGTGHAVIVVSVVLYSYNIPPGIFRLYTCLIDLALTIQLKSSVIHIYIYIYIYPCLLFHPTACSASLQQFMLLTACFEEIGAAAAARRVKH